MKTIRLSWLVVSMLALAVTYSITRVATTKAGAYSSYSSTFGTAQLDDGMISNISAFKEANKTIARRGELVGYSINFDNISPANLSNVVITDTLPTSLIYEPGSLNASSGNYAYLDGTISWTGPITANHSLTITYGATVSLTATIGSSIVNTALFNTGTEVISRTASVKVDYFYSYLPVAFKPPPGLNGMVTLNGAPAAGIPLELHLYDGASNPLVASTTTTKYGSYDFIGVPAFAPGQGYFVLYVNSTDPSRISRWVSAVNTTYNGTNMAKFATFDIGNIVLSQPDPGAMVVLPYTFSWVKRSATPTDSYELILFDPADNDPLFETGALGYTGSYNLSWLPAGFSNGFRYGWGIRAYGPDGGYGESYYYHVLTFTPCLPAFSDDFSNPASGWETLQESDYTMGYLNGEYRITANAGWIAWSALDFGASDYQVEVDARPAGSLDGGVGLLFSIDVNGFYLFEVSEGWFGLWRVAYDPWTWTTLIDWTSSPAIHSGYQTNRLEVVRSGASITLYANGQWLASINDSTYRGSGVGMAAEGFSASFDGRFDNFFWMSKSSCANGATAAQPLIPTTNPEEGLMQHGVGAIRR